MTRVPHLTLIRPPLLIASSAVYPSRAAAPLGMAYVAAAVKKAGFAVSCIDAYGLDMDHFSKFKDGTHINGLSINAVIEQISSDTDIIGLSTMFSNEWILIEELVNAIKKKYPLKMIILGGEHATSEYEYILNSCQAVDGCILGEGEQKTVDLLEAIKLQMSFENVEGFAHRCKVTNSVVIKSGLKRIKQIDEISWPLWEAIPLNKYLDGKVGFGISGTRAMPMLASRGCPYTCTFCSSPKMWTTSWKVRDVEDLIKEIKYYIHLYQIEHVEFYDLTAIINKAWIQSFCRKLIEENLNITWSLPSGTRSEVLDDTTLKLLQQSGIVKMTYSPESGSKKILKLIEKKVKLPKILKSMRLAVKNKIVIKATLISGFPEENFLDLFWNFVFITKLAIIGINDLAYFSFSPYPGSALHDNLVKSGKIIKNKEYYEFLSVYVNNNSTKMKSWSEVIPSRLMPLITIGGMSYFYAIQFLIRPWRIFSSIYRIVKDTPLTMFD
ncbi:MAG: B12-binding domain-containing radical SAM protein, partial [Bdellovibrionales bacterium]|nr:B12-binding domain-containing radical SAM protein [Bdellovibrionales bacterium]